MTTPAIPTADEIGAATSAAALAILTDAAERDANRARIRALHYRAFGRYCPTCRATMNNCKCPGGWSA